MIEVVHADDVTTLILDREAQRNAITPEMLDDLTAAVVRAESEARALVLTGRGTVFSAGADLGTVASTDLTDNPYSAFAERLAASPLPTVCVLNGAAYGAGVEIALACDFRIAVPGVRARIPAAALGIHYPSQGIARIAARFGGQAARRLFLQAEMLDQAALIEMQLVDEVSDEALERGRSRAAEMAALAPLAVAGMKRVLMEAETSAVDHASARTRIAAAFASEDHAEALAARREKRAPRFTGR